MWMGISNDDRHVFLCRGANARRSRPASAAHNTHTVGSNRPLRTLAQAVCTSGTRRRRSSCFLACCSRIDCLPPTRRGSVRAPRARPRRRKTVRRRASAVQLAASHRTLAGARARTRERAGAAAPPLPSHRSARAPRPPPATDLARAPRAGVRRYCCKRRARSASGARASAARPPRASTGGYRAAAREGGGGGTPRGERAALVLRAREDAPAAASSNGGGASDPSAIALRSAARCTCLRSRRCDTAEASHRPAAVGRGYGGASSGARARRRRACPPRAAAAAPRARRGRAPRCAAGRRVVRGRARAPPRAHARSTLQRAAQRVPPRRATRQRAHAHTHTAASWRSRRAFSGGATFSINNKRFRQNVIVIHRIRSAMWMMYRRF